MSNYKAAKDWTFKWSKPKRGKAAAKPWAKQYTLEQVEESIVPFSLSGLTLNQRKSMRVVEAEFKSDRKERRAKKKAEKMEKVFRPQGKKRKKLIEAFKALGQKKA